MSNRSFLDPELRNWPARRRGVVDILPFGSRWRVACTLCSDPPATLDSEDAATVTALEHLAVHTLLEIELVQLHATDGKVYVVWNGRRDRT